MHGLKLTLTCLVVMILILSSVISAQPLFEKGTRELDAAGSFHNYSVDDLDDPIHFRSLSGAYGYFIQDNQEVGGRFSYYSSGIDEDVLKVQTLNAFFLYYLDSESTTTFPYIGAAIGFGSGEMGPLEFDTTNYGPAGGLKYAIHDTFSFNAQVSYWIVQYDTDEGDDEGNRFALDFGLSYFF